MTITLAPVTLAEARKLADREGKSLDVVVNEILDEVLGLPGMLDDAATKVEPGVFVATDR